MDVVRAALIGFGGMGQNYARLLYAGLIPGMVLTGVCCRNTPGQELLSREFPGVTLYRDLEDMTAHASEYDAAIIVTPHASHVDIGMQLAALGKHILMDKPAGIGAGEVRQLVDFCHARGVAFGMIFNNRQLPVFRAAKRLLDAGALGTLHRAVWVCNSWYRSPAYHRSAGWRSSWSGEGGGLMINQNPHYLDMWNWFFGMPQRVYADMAFGRYNDFGVDDAVDIQLLYDNGFHGTFVSATGEAPGVNRLEVWGSRGCMTLEGERLYLDENAMSVEEFGAVNEEKFAQIPHKRRRIETESSENPYVAVFRNFAAHLLEGEPLAADGLDGLRQVQLANAVYVSGWEERKVTVPVDPARYLSGLEARKLLEKSK